MAGISILSMRSPFARKAEMAGVPSPIGSPWGGAPLCPAQRWPKLTSTMQQYGFASQEADKPYVPHISPERQPGPLLILNI